MKKPIALLLVIAFCLSGCELVSGNVGDNSGIQDSEINNSGSETPGTDDTITDEPGTDEPGTDDPGTDDPGTDTPGTGDSDDTECLSHKDSNDDGYCDECLESVIVIIDLFAINDLHGKVKASNSQYGLGVLTTYLENEADENSVLFSSGDMWQGSSESNLTHGALVTEWMNEMGFVSMTLGNHEYDWADEYIRANAELAEFPFLAINVYDKSTNERAEYATPSVVVSRGGIEIGIIGAIGDCYSSISGEVSGDFYFKVGDELTELVKAESDRLKAQGVEFIVYSIHDGYGSSSSGTKFVNDNAISGYYDIELSRDYVDIVFEAHTHQSYILTDSRGVYHLQGGGENKGLSTAKLHYNIANENKSVISPKIVKSDSYKYLSESSLIGELLEKYAEFIDDAYRVLGINSKYLDDSEVEQIVADLYYRYGLEKWGEEYDIILGGGFVRTRNPYNLKPGEITYSDIYSLLPFDNELVLCSVKGSDLFYKFITTDNSDYYISYGSNDVSNIDFNKTYYIVTDTYTSTYRYNNLTEVARFGDGVYARDLFAEFVEEGGLS